MYHFHKYVYFSGKSLLKTSSSVCKLDRKLEDPVMKLIFKKSVTPRS